MPIDWMPRPKRDISTYLIKKIKKTKSKIQRLCLDGFYDIARAQSKTEAILWSIALLFSYLAAVHPTISIVQNFFSKSTVISLTEDDNGIIKIPKIAVCHTANFNRSYFETNVRISDQILQKSSMSKNRLLAEFARYINIYNPFVNVGTFTDDLFEILTEIYENNFGEWMRYDSVVTDAAFRTKEIFRRCQYAGQSIPCQLILLPLDIPSCYFLHINKTIEGFDTDVVGFNEGIKFEILLETKHIFSNFEADKKGLDDYFLDDPGIRLQFGRTPGPISPAVTFPGNTHAIIELSYSEIKLKHNCLEDWQEGAWEDYRQEMCILWAITGYVRDVCKCKFYIADSSASKEELCLPKAMRDCVQPLVSASLKNVTNLDIAGDMDKIKHRCKQKCKVPVHGTVSSSFYNLEPADDTEKYIRNKVTIFYASTKKYVQEEKEFHDIYALFSNIGGVLCFYIGFSCVAFVQAVAYILFKCISICHVCIYRMMAYWLRQKISIFMKPSTRICPQKRNISKFRPIRIHPV